MKRGKQTPDFISDFVIATYLGDPTLSGREIAAGVEAEFGPETSIDKTTVTRIIKRAGLGGHRTNQPRRRLFEIPERWPHGFLTGTKETLRGPAATRWSTDRPQQPGDDFGLDLGQEVPIRSIKFLQGTQHQWDHPKGWQMIFSNNQGTIVKEVEGKGVGLTNFIEAELDEPLLVRHIGVVILEPRLPTDHPPATCWAVDNIRLE